jgi:hypothetical protein
MKPRRVVLVDGAGENDAGVHLGQTSLSAGGPSDLYLRLVHAPDEPTFRRETERVLSLDAPPFGVLEAVAPDGRRISLPVPQHGEPEMRQVEGLGTVAFVADFLARDWRQALNPNPKQRVALQDQTDTAPMVHGRFVVKPEAGDPKLLPLYVFSSGFEPDGEDPTRAGFAGWHFAFTRESGLIFGDWNGKLVLGPGGRVVLVLPSGEDGLTARVVEVPAGGPVPIADTGAQFRLERVVARGDVSVQVTPRDDKARSVVRDDLSPFAPDYVSASRFRITPPSGAGAPEEFWLTSMDRRAYRFGRSKEMRLRLEEQPGNARDFRSYVTILEGGTASEPAGREVFGHGCEARGPGPRLTGATPTVENHLVQVNVPLWYRGYKLYQSRFNANEPEFSGLIVKRDRGLPWVYVGLPLTFVGILWMLIVDPALARRRAKKRAETAPKGRA